MSVSVRDLEQRALQRAAIIARLEERLAKETAYRDTFDRDDPRWPYLEGIRLGLEQAIGLAGFVL